MVNIFPLHKGEMFLSLLHYTIQAEIYIIHTFAGYWFEINLPD